MIDDVESSNIYNVSIKKTMIYISNFYVIFSRIRNSLYNSRNVLLVYKKEKYKRCY